MVAYGQQQEAKCLEHICAMWGEEGLMRTKLLALRLVARVLAIPIALPEEHTFALGKAHPIIDAIRGVLIPLVLLLEAHLERLLHGLASIVHEVLIFVGYCPQVDAILVALGGLAEIVGVVPQPAKGAKPYNVSRFHTSLLVYAHAADRLRRPWAWPAMLPQPAPVPGLCIRCAASTGASGRSW